MTRFAAGLMIGAVLSSATLVSAQAEEAATREIAQVNAYFANNPLPGVVSIRFGTGSGLPELRVVAGDELAFQWSEANREKRLVVMQRLARAVLSMAPHFGLVTVLLFDLNGNQIDHYTEFR
jgi:hypothetical protein